MRRARELPGVFDAPTFSILYRHRASRVTRFKFVRSRLLAGPPNLAWRLSLALLFVGMPTLLRMAIDPVITGTSFVTYYPFVLAAALVIGRNAAAGVMLADALLANFLFMEPRYELFAKAGDTIGVMFFLVSCSMTIALVDTLRRTFIDVEASSQREAGLNAELRHLNSELQHRIKNTLTVVQALATQTFRGTAGSEEAVRAFRGRLHALAEANEVLVSGKWEQCQLPDLVIRALAPFNGHGAVRIAGPVCSLPEQACVPLVLALHELGTNATKYGALSALNGSIDVCWTIRSAHGDDAAQEIVLEWTESGGPPVETPDRRGLGSKLIAPQSGIDDATLDFRPQGVACRLVVGGALQLA